MSAPDPAVGLPVPFGDLASSSRPTARPAEVAGEVPLDVDRFALRREDSVVAVLPDTAALRAFTADLPGEGVAPADVTALHGTEGLRVLDPEGRHHGVRARAQRAVQRHGADGSELARRTEALAAGRVLVAVAILTYAQRDAVAELARRHGATDVSYRGPEPSDAEPSDAEPPALAVAPQPRPPALRPGVVVVGWNGSEGAHAALRWASRLADGAGAELRVVGCWTRQRFWGRAYTGPADGVPSEEELAATARDALQRVVAEVVGDRPVPVSTSAVHSAHPAEVLVEESRRAGLLVLGTRGHGAARAAVLGSVSADVVRDAACPVAVLPPGVSTA